MSATTTLDLRLPKRRLYKQLVEVALSVAPSAYAPFSDYRVGCAVLLWDGRVYTGVNTENPGLGLTIHGEMSAINAAIADGAVNQAVEAGLTATNFIKAIAIIPLRSYLAWACGHCRDFIAGFGVDMDIVVRTQENEPVWKRMARLLPFADAPEERIQDACTGRLLKGACTHGHQPMVVADAPVNTPYGIRPFATIAPVTAKTKAYPALLQYARAAAALSYAPYSKRPAGAAVWLYDGSVYTGSRVENVGYTLSTDPDQAALTAAVQSGALDAAVRAGKKPTEFVRAIAYSVPGRPNAWPNGSSRQCMCDFGTALDVVAEDAQGKPVHRTLAKLLPGAFVPDVLSYWTA